VKNTSLGFSSKIYSYVNEVAIQCERLALTLYLCMLEPCANFRIVTPFIIILLNKKQNERKDMRHVYFLWPKAYYNNQCSVYHYRNFI